MQRGYYNRNKGVEPPDAWFLRRDLRGGQGGGSGDSGVDVGMASAVESGGRRMVYRGEDHGGGGGGVGMGSAAAVAAGALGPGARGLR